jgi:hypothetical protein
MYPKDRTKIRRSLSNSPDGARFRSYEKTLSDFVSIYRGDSNHFFERGKRLLIGRKEKG